MKNSSLLSYVGVALMLLLLSPNQALAWPGEAEQDPAQEEIPGEYEIKAKPLSLNEPIQLTLEVDSPRPTQADDLLGLNFGQMPIDDDPSVPAPGGKVLPTDQIRFTLWSSSLWNESIRRGREFSYTTGGIFNTVAITVRGGEFLDKHLQIDPGLYLNGTWSTFRITNSVGYEGDQSRYGGGLRLEFRYRPNRGLPETVIAIGELGLDYSRVRGRTGAGYSAEVETTFATAGLSLEFPWPFLSLGGNSSRRVIMNGNEIKVFEGVLPYLNLRGKFMYPVHNSRRTTAGSTDRHRENRFEWGAELGLFTVNNSCTNMDTGTLAEFSVFASADGDWSYASGMNSIQNETDVYSIYGGGGVRLNLNRRFYFSLGGQIGTRLGTGDMAARGILGLGVSF